MVKCLKKRHISSISTNHKKIAACNGFRCPSTKAYDKAKDRKEKNLKKKVLK